MELKNYRKFRQCALEFPDGVIGIVGPNGAGKSSLIEAIAWALYGNETEIVRTTKEQVRWMGAGPNDECRVMLEFDIEGDSYRLERTMKGKDLKVDATLIVNEKPEAKGDKAVSEEISRRLGMDHKAFFISVFARQKELNALSSFRPFERKKLILRMLDIDVLDRVVSDIDRDASVMKKSLEMTTRSLLADDGRQKRDVLAGDIKTLEERIDTAQKDLAPLKEEIASLDVRVSVARERRDLALKRDEEHRRLNERGVEKRERVRNLESRRGELSAEIRGLKEKLDEICALKEGHEEYLALATEVERMERHVRRHEERKNLERSLSELKEKMSEVSSEIAQKKEVLTPLDGFEDRLKTVEENLEETDRQMSSARERLGWIVSETRRIAEETQETRSRKEGIESLGPESPCPTCERQLGDHHAALVAKLSREIEDKEERTRGMEGDRLSVEKELERLGRKREALERRKKELKKQQREGIQLSTSVDQLSRDLEKLSDERHRLEERIEGFKDLMFDESEFAAAKARIQDLKDVESRYTEMRIESQRLPGLEEEHLAIEAQVGEARSVLESLESEIAEMGYQQDERQKALADYEEALQARESRRSELVTKEAEMSLDQREIRIRKEQLEETVSCENRIAAKTKDMEQLTVLGSAMKEFRSNVMSRIVPTLSGISSTLLTDLTESRYGGMDLDENYEIHIFDGGVKYPLSRFSGGEGDLANLCLRLAISRVIADRAGSTVNFLILDEIFGSQDQTRKRSIMMTLNELSKQFHQIVLITHIEDVKDFMGHVINVKEREDGTSEIALEG
ncbi:MAG: SMC family ATPase [Methanomassiliicoccales archaeon]|nr:SMC family ATPase [Methanomassiliicoccales archaeon]